MPSRNPVDEFLSCIENAGMGSCTAFADSAIFDATVPNWRYSVVGARDISSELARWYADPGRFEDLRRTPTPDGEVVEFTLCWKEQGVPHSCRQAHVLEVEGGFIVADRAWCGGRWPASLMAEMAAAARG